MLKKCLGFTVFHVEGHLPESANINDEFAVGAASSAELCQQVFTVAHPNHYKSFRARWFLMIKFYIFDKGCD